MGTVFRLSESRGKKRVSTLLTATFTAFITAFGVGAFCVSSTVLAEDEQGFVDFSDQITPVCELQGLTTLPPTDWINVPIQTGDEPLAGCQMMLIIDEALVGVLRVWSFDWSAMPADSDPWPQQVMALESVWIEEMGYRIVEPVWRRSEVPISGPGFGNGQAMGFAVRIEGNQNPQESHMLVFDRGDYKYLINLLTPAKSVDGGRHYERNTQGMASVMQGFKLSQP